MKNGYFKSFLLFLLLCSFTANTTLAIPFLAKVNTVAMEGDVEQKDLDEKLELKVELGILVAVNFYAQPCLIDLDALAIATFKFRLPRAFHSLPELPPRK